jgi:hypothetical protein
VATANKTEEDTYKTTPKFQTGSASALIKPPLVQSTKQQLNAPRLSDTTVSKKTPKNPKSSDREKSGKALLQIKSNEIVFSSTMNL